MTMIIARVPFSRQIRVLTLFPALAAGACASSGELDRHSAAGASAAASAHRGADERTAFQTEVYRVETLAKADPAYAGFRIEQLESPTAHFYFTSNAADRLKKLTEDSRFRAHPAVRTLAQLERTKAEATDRLLLFKIPFHVVAIDIARNDVVVSLRDPARFEAAKREGFSLPQNVRIVT